MAEALSKGKTEGGRGRSHLSLVLNGMGGSGRDGGACCAAGGVSSMGRRGRAPERALNDTSSVMQSREIALRAARRKKPGQSHSLQNETRRRED